MPSLRKSCPISYTRSNPPTISRLRYSSSAMRRIERHVERVVVRHERARGGAAVQRLQHRRLHLEIAERRRGSVRIAVVIASARVEVRAHLRMHGQIGIPLAIALLRVGEAGVPHQSRRPRPAPCRTAAGAATSPAASARCTRTVDLARARAHQRAGTPTTSPRSQFLEHGPLRRRPCRPCGSRAACAPLAVG